jgi:hypothetical protein
VIIAATGVDVFKALQKDKDEKRRKKALGTGTELSNQPLLSVQSADAPEVEEEAKLPERMA